MNENLHRQVIDLNNRIINCRFARTNYSDRENYCQVQGYYDIPIYPEIINIGEKYSERVHNEPKPVKVMFLGIEPKQNAGCLELGELDAFTKLSVLFEWQGFSNKNLPISANSTPPKINFDFHRFLLHQFRTTHQSNNQWEITGIDGFLHTESNRQITHKFIWNSFLGIDFQENSPWDYEINTNLTLCGKQPKPKIEVSEDIDESVKFKYPHPNNLMRRRCLNQGYLETLFKIASPDVVFCLGTTPWDYLINHQLYFPNNVISEDETFTKEYDFIKRYNIYNHPTTFQLISHLSRFNKNSRWIRNLVESGVIELDMENGLQLSLFHYLARIFRELSPFITN